MSFFSKLPHSGHFALIFSKLSKTVYLTHTIAATVK